jgi:glycosyltransferase involved in cell wall biosynthesis
MRILHIYKTYYTESFGGVEQFIRQLGMQHAKRGHDVSVFMLTRDGVQEEVMADGIRVLKYPLTVEFASNGFSFAAMRDFRRVASQADVLNYHFPWPSGDVLHQLAPKDIPAVVTYHSDIIRQKRLKHLYAPLMHRFLSQMDAILATSPNYVATSPVLQRYAAKTRVIPIGIDETSYPAPDYGLMNEMKSLYGQDFFLFLGIIRYYKGLHTLVEAAAKSGLRTVIAGDGPELEKLKAQAQELNAPVTFLGRVDDTQKVALLNLCRGFVFPSHQRSEAFGVSLLEAAMASKPMITCEIGSGMSYINQHGNTGVIVPPEDADAFAGAMELIASDDMLAAQMGQAARARYEALFTANKMADDYLALYTELLHNHAA